MKVQQLGHVVLKVRERGRSERFYTEVLGLQIAARRDAPPMTFFTLGNHHDFAIVALGDTPDPPANSPVCTMSPSRLATRSMIFAGPRRTSTRSASRLTRSRITRWRRASTSMTRTATRSRYTPIPPMSGAPIRKRLRASPRLPSSTASAEWTHATFWRVSALQGEPFDQLGRETPPAAVGQCWAGQANQALGPVAQGVSGTSGPVPVGEDIESLRTAILRSMPRHHS